AAADRIAFSRFTCSSSIATFTAKISNCASSIISGRRRNSRTLMRWSSKSSAMCNRRANWRRRNQLGASKIQPGQIADFRSLADSEDDSERADYEAATKREDQQQPNREIRHLDHALANKGAATGKEVGHSGSD